MSLRVSDAAAIDYARDAQVLECLREEVKSQRTARLIELRRWDG
jgi:hypothetical protein